MALSNFRKFDPTAWAQRRWVLALILTVLPPIGAVAYMSAENIKTVLIPTIVGCMGIAVCLIPASTLVYLYFGYLLIEGAAKIWTNYNPIIHVASDAFLVFVVVRLHNRSLQFAHREEHATFKQKTFIKINWVMNALCLYWVWVALQFLNPWSLGILPSIAGLKLHLIPELTFILIAFYLQPEEIKMLPFLLVGMGLVESSLSIVDWLCGPWLWSSFNPQYGDIYFQFLQGEAYRPFGTTYLPGAPSVWMYHCGVGTIFSIDLLRKNNLPKLLAPYKKVLWGMIFLFIPLGIVTLIACQVRYAFIRFIMLMLVGTYFISKAYRNAVIILGCCLMIFLLTADNSKNVEDRSMQETVNGKFTQALSRMQTLQKGGTYTKARGGFASFHEIFRRAAFTMEGIGLSRISAASRPWAHLIANDKYFGFSWSFADSLYVALFTEIGFGGLVVFLFMMAVIAVQLYGIGTYSSKIAFFVVVMAVIGGYSNEGILYQPDAAMFWFAVAFGIKSAAFEPIEVSRSTELLPRGQRTVEA